MTAMVDADGHCIRTDLLPEYCAHCRGITDELASTITIVEAFRSPVAGRCPGCDRDYKANAQVGRTDDGEVVCKRCFPD